MRRAAPGCRRGRHAGRTGEPVAAWRDCAYAELDYGFRRARQVAGIAERANACTNAVILAGDTNLHGWSWIFGDHLGRYRDPFSLAGAGFGYTFPAHRPWMRIDRILMNDRLRAVEFRAGPATKSDHRSVFAALAPAG